MQHCAMGTHSYGNGATRKFAKSDPRHLPSPLRVKAVEILDRLRHGDFRADLQADDRQIHRLTGDRKGADAIATSGRWRVVLRLHDGNAYDVRVVAYRKS